MNPILSRNVTRSFFSFFAFSSLFLFSCGGGGGSGGTSTTTTTTTAAKISIAGTVTVNTAGKPSAIGNKRNYAPLANATVALYSVTADGTATQVDIGTVTTASDGSYTISDVDVPTTGTGEATDSYYEIRVTGSGGEDVRAPAAPTADATVDVSPETNLAAHIISDVVDVPTSSSNPVPSADMIEDLRDMVEQNATSLASSITIPETTTGKETDTVTAASGMTTAGGNAETGFRAYQFESEYLEVSSSTASVDDASSYIYRVTREGLGQDVTGNPVTEAAADALAGDMISGTTYTAEEVVNAYNANNGTAADLPVATAVSDYSAQLARVDAITASSAADMSAMSSSDRIAFYTRRDLTGSGFTSSTSLTPDQAMSFIQTLPSTQGNFGTVDVTGVVAGLTGDTSLGGAAISDVQIYADAGFGCTGQNKLHFRAKVFVYNPSSTNVGISSVTVVSSDTTALSGGTATLTGDGGVIRWINSDTESNPLCVSADTQATYTVTVTFTDSTTLTKQVTRTHPNIQEPTTTYGGASVSKDSSSPTVVTETRPVISWTSPSSTLSVLNSTNTNQAPANTSVKYTYEFAHFRRATAGLLSSDTYPSCASVSSGALYAVDSFIPTVDCDVAACASEAGTTAGDIACRFNVQTYLVDENDNLYGQAAGNFTWFCVDTNGDGNCG